MQTNNSKNLQSFFIGFAIMFVVCAACVPAAYCVGYKKATLHIDSMIQLLIDDCQKELPRTQTCTLKAVIDDRNVQ